MVRDNPVRRIRPVEQADLANLSFNDEVVKQALLSFESTMAIDFEELTLKHHGREPLWDADVGAARDDLFNVDRCGHPELGMQFMQRQQHSRQPRIGRMKVGNCKQHRIGPGLGKGFAGKRRARKQRCGTFQNHTAVYDEA